jgi:hypothetical protein
MESIAFKEWAIVCEALGRGGQSIILRKGGIAEGREGFSFPGLHKGSRGATARAASEGQLTNCFDEEFAFRAHSFTLRVKLHVIKATIIT